MATIGYNLNGSSSLLFLDTAAFHLEEGIYGYTALAGDVVDGLFWRGNDNGNLATSAEIAVYDVIAGVITNMVGGSFVVPIVGGADAWFTTGAINIPLVAGTVYIVASVATNSPLTRVQTGLPNHSHELRPANPLPDPWPVAGVLRGWANCMYANVTNAPPPPAVGIIYPCCAQLIT